MCFLNIAITTPTNERKTMILFHCVSLNTLLNLEDIY